MTEQERKDALIEAINILTLSAISKEPFLKIGKALSLIQRVANSINPKRETVDIYWTYINWEDERQDCECYSQAEALKQAEEDFNAKCEQDLADGCPDTEREESIKLVQFVENDDGEKLILETVKDWVAWEKGYDLKAEHGTLY